MTQGRNDRNDANITVKKSGLAWLYDILNARLVVAGLAIFLAGTITTLPFAATSGPDRTEVLMEEIAEELRGIRQELEVQNRIDWEDANRTRDENYRDWRARHDLGDAPYAGR